MENIRPPVQDDLLISLSYDQLEFNNTNIYFPTWYMLAGLIKPSVFKGDGVEIDSKSLLKPRILDDLTNKKLFACAIIGNPHPIRLKAIQSLRKIGKVDVFGRITGTLVSNKFEVARNYRYTVCFENDLYPGYVTEKLLQAYATGTIPIYWGDLGNDIHINRDCFVNLKDFKSIDDFINYIAAIDENKYRQMYEQPFLKSIPDISGITNLLVNSL